MGDALVSPLVELISLVREKLEEELRLAANARVEFDNLVAFIRHMSRFLEKAYSKEVIDESLKDLMKRMRKFLYVSQDAMDDLMQRQSNLGWEGLASYLSIHYRKRRFAALSMAIQQMLADYTTIAASFAALETSHGLSRDHALTTLANHRPSSIAYSMETDGQLVGIDEPRGKLVQWLTENHSMSKVIFVHGMQGVGKTSLVGTVLRNEKVKSHFKYYVWVEDIRSWELNGYSTVAPLEAIAEMWNLTDNQHDRVELGEAFRRVREDENLRNNEDRWALVLDDISSTHAFKSLQCHFDRTCSSVLITSRFSSLKYSLESMSGAFLDSPVAQPTGTQPGGAPPRPPRRFRGFHTFYYLIPPFISSLASILRAFLDFARAQPSEAPPDPSRRLHGFYHYKHVFLSSDDSFTLFLRKTFSYGHCPTDLKEASNSILEKSEGLPLAILATCELLQDNQVSVTGTPVSVSWNKLSDKLGKELILKGDQDYTIRRMITLRMDHLLDVRASLFYLSIFPLECPIRCSVMMRLWMAERLLKQDPVQTLRMLLEHNVIQEKTKTSYGRVNTCHVHNLLHQIIISKSIDEEFAMIVDGPVENWPENVWHLSFHSDMNSEYEGTWVELLRSLLVFKMVYPKSLKNLLRNARRLNVLDLQRHCSESSLGEFPREIFRSKFLRYLSLRGTKVKKIPNGIRDLAYLETLDLKDTLVDKLPPEILELKELRHLLVCRYDRSPAARNNPKLGVKAPSKLGLLKSLQKLCMIELYRVKRHLLPRKDLRRKELLEELGKLKNLRRLCISMLRTTDGKLLCSSIEELTNLETLSLIAAPEQEIVLSEVNEKRASKSLQRVHLTGRLKTLPKWILSLSLVKLVLKGSQLNVDPLQQLGELRSLKHLEMQQAFDVREMTFKAGWFPQLRFLGLDTIDNLESIKVENEALRTLEILSLAQCQSLKIVPQDITRLKQLKRLELYEMPEDFNTAVYGNEEVCAHIKVYTKIWEGGAPKEVIPLPAHPAGPSVPHPCMK